MSAERAPLRIRRILVALDASPHSLAALEAAVDLATRFQAELAGLFVEDENLLRLTELPFLQEMGLFSATRRRIPGKELAREIRVHGRHVRRVFTGRIQRARVTWSFRVAQGIVPREVLAAAREADLLVLGKTGWSLLRRRRLGSTVRHILPEPFGLALILTEGARLAAPAAVVYDGSPAADKALLAANTIARQADDDQELVVLLLAREPANMEALRDQAKSRLAERKALLRFRALNSDGVLQWWEILRVEGCGLLALPARSTALLGDALVNLLEQLELPVLLVT